MNDDFSQFVVARHQQHPSLTYVQYEHCNCCNRIMFKKDCNSVSLILPKFFFIVPTIRPPSTSTERMNILGFLPCLLTNILINLHKSNRFLSFVPSAYFFLCVPINHYRIRWMTRKFPHLFANIDSIYLRFLYDYNYNEEQWMGLQLLLLLLVFFSFKVFYILWSVIQFYFIG